MKTTSKFLSLFLMMVCVLAVRGAEPDGPDVRALYSSKTRAVFESGDYAQLEKTADELRKTKERFGDGLWKLTAFYEGTNPQTNASGAAKWQRCFSRLDDWQKAFPNSITQPVARAATLVSYAWDARGNGYANTVTEDGWKAFGERIDQAREVLEEAWKLPVRDPDPYGYDQMLIIAMAQSWDRAKYDALFAQAVAAEPGYCDCYFAKASAVLPRWGGEEDDWIDFADEAATKNDPEEGMSMYARIFWAHDSYTHEGFKNPKVEWNKVRQGFRDIEKHYPDSKWNLSHFCRYACLAGDRETAHELFGRLGNTMNLPTWQSRGAFEQWRRWAGNDAAAAAAGPRASLALPEPEDDLVVNALSFSPDGKTLLAGYSGGEITLWNLEARQPAWTGSLGGRGVRAVAFSPDGKTLAAGTGGDYETKAAGVVGFWDAKTHEATATVEGRSGNVFGLAFTPDSKTLAIVGGFYGSEGRPMLGEAALYDMDAHKLDPLPWDHENTLTTLAISRDGQFLVTSKSQSVNCYSLAKRDFVNDYHTHITHDYGVCAVAISPDSRMLITGSSPGWSKREIPGEMRRWDMTKPGWPEIKSPTWDKSPTGLMAAAFSPDGKWLAAGGQDGGVYLWDTATGKRVAGFVGHQQRIGALAFAPDSKTLVSGAADGTIKWWDVPKPAGEP